jgi:acetyl-CoA synthetase
VLATLPENLPETTAAELLAAGIAPLLGIDDALSAIDAAIGIGAAYRRPVAGPLRFAAGHDAGETTTLPDEWSAKQQLAAYGITVPRSRIVNAADAAAGAEDLGYPLVVKALNAQLTHKTEHAAVALDLSSAAAVTQVIGRMRKQGLAERFLLETMISDGVAELIVGIQRDPRFGLYLLLGCGGVLVELLGDSRLLLLPATRGDIEQALRELRVWPLLQGYRGRPAADMAALITAIANVARFAEDHSDRLLELDINPLIVRPQGYGVAAVDALIVCRA